ncbi:MAG: periplasmic heavy metal sensor [Brevinematales bacterium]|nr:periplasmic heavy metal sensor [Brevinematales bacterium]
MKRLWFILSIVTLSTVTLFGQTPPPNPQEEVVLLPLVRAEMSLSVEQKQKIEAIETNFQAQNRERVQQLNQLRIQLREALTADTLDEPKLLQLQERIETIQREIARLRFQADLEMVRVLTKEQRKEWLKRSSARPQQPGPNTPPPPQGNAGGPGPQPKQPGPNPQPKK